MTVIAENRRARHDYLIEDTLEAGLVLTGPEIKAVRGRHITLNGSYAKMIGTEAFLVGANFVVLSGDPARSRKLLLSKRELLRLSDRLERDRATVVPLDLHLKGGWAKVTLGIGRRKKKQDRREELKKRSFDRSNKS